MDEGFLEACLNWPHTVMGRGLLPFNLWHFVNLENARSPFVGHPGEKDLPALAVAALICTSTPDTDLRLVYPPLDPRDRSKWIRRQVRPFRNHLARERDKFHAYQLDYSQGPRVYDGTGEKPKVPWPQAVAARLMHLGGMSKFEAWTAPFGWALWDAVALAEANGGNPGVMSEAEARQLREAGWHV